MKIELQSSIKVEKKYLKEVAIASAVLKSRTEKAIKALQQEKESWEKKQKVYDRKLDDLRMKFNETLDQSLKRVYGAFNQETG